MLAFRVLGPLEVTDSERQIALGGPKQRATLAILLLNANRVVSVERIADDLYAGRPPVTAVTQVQRQISDLRRVLGTDAGIETQPPGYRIALERDQLDLSRFERLAEEGAVALERGDATRSTALLGEALALWRGEPLADVARESFAQIAIARLDEIRIAALESRIEADLACGRHRQVIAELEELVDAYPYRETLHAQRMLALYRSGRQVEALDAFRAARDLLNGRLGLDPGLQLRRLERAILEHDRSLEISSDKAWHRGGGAAVLALPASDERVVAVVRFSSPLVTGESAELIVARLLTDEAELAPAMTALGATRAVSSPHIRIAAFTTRSSTDDVLRLVASHDVELVVVDVAQHEAEVPSSVVELLSRSPVDVAVVAPAVEDMGEGVVVPFAGGENDWAALELGARIASATSQRLALVGTKAGQGRRDASRLLADASLAVQRLIGVEATPMLAEASAESLLAAVEPAASIVIGFPSRWRTGGLGEVRLGLVRGTQASTVLVHRGPRPGGLAPRGSGTRFTWTIEPSSS